MDKPGVLRPIPDRQPAVVRTLCLAALAGALEFYDFFIFAFFVPVIGRLFFSVGLADWVRSYKHLGSLPSAILRVRWAAS